MTKEQRDFVSLVEGVSSSLAVWVQERFENGWSLSDVKHHLRVCATLAERN